MKTAHDLFLSEETRDQKARRSVTDIIAEDDADLIRLAELAETTISYRKLSRLKSACAWFMLHKRVTVVAFSAATLGIAALFIVPSLVIRDADVKAAIEVATVLSETKASPEVKLPDVAKTEVPIKEPKIEALQTYVQTKNDEKDRLLSNDLGLVPPPVLTPITSVQVRELREHLNKTTPKVAVAPPTVVGTVAVPINQVNIHEESVEAPEEARSASDFIDQFGFGTEPKIDVAPTTSEGIGNVEAENATTDVITVPVSKAEDEKPTAVEEIKDVRYQIIDRDGERAGFRRMKDKNPDTTQWFLVIEAVDARGKAIPMPVMSMDTGEVKVVTRWAIQVPEKDFMKFSDEKKKTGKIANTVIGSAPSNQKEPKWSVKLTGNMLTEWE